MVLTLQREALSAKPAALRPADFALCDAREFGAHDLWPFLALAAHESDAEAAMRVAYLQRFLAGWPRSGDFGFVAMQDDAPVGAAWARQFNQAQAPDFFVDLATPELVIAVLPHLQGRGCGRLLLESLADEAQRRGTAGLCLTVREVNPAVSLYAGAGFEAVARGRNRVGGQSLGMVRRFGTAGEAAGY